MSAFTKSLSNYDYSRHVEKLPFLFSTHYFGVISSALNEAKTIGVVEAMKHYEKACPQSVQDSSNYINEVDRLEAGKVICIMKTPGITNLSQYK